MTGVRVKRLIIVIFFLGLLADAPCLAYDEPFATGKDWVKRMSPREKFISLIPPTLLFSEYNVQIRLSLPQYIFLIDRIMKRNPRLENEELSNIFASTIYFFEPQNREALKTMEMNFLKGDLETKPYHTPRLTIEDILKEVSE